MCQFIYVSLNFLRLNCRTDVNEIFICYIVFIAENCTSRRTPINKFLRVMYSPTLVYLINLKTISYTVVNLIAIETSINNYQHVSRQRSYLMPDKVHIFID